MTNYNKINLQLEKLIANVSNNISNLANASALLFHSLKDINWVGFYILEKGALVLGPFQGNIACTRIEIGKGVCGTAVAQTNTIVVDNVHEFPGHIACDCNSKSEIVIPIWISGSIVGVLDIDSPIYSRFNIDDKNGLEAFVKILEKYWINE